MKRDLEHFKRYGWKCNEDNLKTLPSSAPPSVRNLSKWLTLEGRRSSLQEWIPQVQSDGKIHGKFWHIGAWTHRMSHSKPNQGNIFSVYPSGRTPVNAVEEVKKKYDGELRSCWRASEGKYLVGVDAESIQLRVLAHYMDSKTYVDAIVGGDKALETDIHNVNKKALGPICRSRDDAKTFIYAWLLGAANPKIASILECTESEAKTAVSSFLTALPELKDLKTKKIPYDARKGFFTGLDGRQVKCKSEHLMLAGYLQNGESVIMKHANVKWRKDLDSMGIPYKQIDMVHDEWVTEVNSLEDAQIVMDVQCDALVWVGKDLGLKCPLAGEGKVGRTWLEIH